MVHVLPPALAWIWRLVSPRGHANPSITAGKKLMQSEGVGSYWPFATGKKVTQANLLLRQMAAAPSLNYSLTPNQHVGAWKTGFMSEWLGRSVLSMADDSFFAREECIPARCTLLGYTPRAASVGDFDIPEYLLRVEKQPEVGEETYDAGAAMLVNFFKEEVQQFMCKELDPAGQKIITLFLQDAPIEKFEGIL
jgi:hypothetical protein